MSDLPKQNKNFDRKPLNRGQSLFFNDRQWQFVKHISAQLVQHVAKQQVYYYQLDQSTMSGRNNLYGQRKNKVWKAPKILYARIMRQPVNTTKRKFGPQSVHAIRIFFDKNHLDTKGVDINRMMGNQLQWDHKRFLLGKAQLFDGVKGMTDYKMTVLVTGIYTQD